MDGTKGYFDGVSGFVGRMTPSQVMMLLGVTAGSIVGIVYLVGWLSTANYAPLYTNLDESEAGDVIGYLADNKIPYSVTGGGRVIEVPSADVYKTRIAMASEGLPKSGIVGYSIFDQNNLGMTDFLQNLNFRRALEGELTRTIMQISEVQAARVHIVMPKDRLFREDKRDATASVALKLKGASSLNKRQVSGISHLVASSVEGLTPENITIVDYDGNLLSSPQSHDALAGLSSSQLEVRKEVESYLEQKAQSMLDNVLGNGKAVIRVTADLNFAQLERTSEDFDSDNPAVRSEERNKQSSAESDKAEEKAETKKDDNTETVVTNYELDKTVEHIVNATGTIQRLSLAVLVDGTYQIPEGAEEGASAAYQPRSQEEIDRLSAIVKNAVGYDQTRNDQVEIINIPFDRQAVEQDRQALDSMYTREFYTDIVKQVGIVLLIAFLFFYAKKKAKTLFEALGKMIPPAHSQPHQASAHMYDMPAPEPVSAPEQRKARVADKMHEAAKTQPDEVARVIQTMMME
jgi:flagellar M-ring protein FliF